MVPFLMTFPRVLLGAWASEDGTKVLTISSVDDEAHVLVRAPDKRVLFEKKASWTPPKDGAEQSPSARERLGYLRVETGDEGLGNTYDLMPGRETSEGKLQWVRLKPDTAQANVRLFPDVGASFYEAVLGMYDDFVEEQTGAETSWVGELSTYLPLLD